MREEEIREIILDELVDEWRQTGLPMEEIELVDVTEVESGIWEFKAEIHYSCAVFDFVFVVYFVVYGVYKEDIGAFRITSVYVESIP
jgi:hypothetical protein